jgi:hypothetical protein
MIASSTRRAVSIAIARKDRLRTPSRPINFNFLGQCAVRSISRNSYVVWLNPAAFPGIIDNGVPQTDHQQQYGVLELNYRPTDT